MKYQQNQIVTCDLHTQDNLHMTQYTLEKNQN